MTCHQVEQGRLTVGALTDTAPYIGAPTSLDENKISAERTTMLVQSAFGRSIR